MSKGVFPSVLFLVLIALSLFSGCATQGPGVMPAAQCSADSDCVPAECCHPTACIPVTDKKPCNLMCTMECRPGTLDCGQGSCRCSEGRCEAVYETEGAVYE